MMSFPTDRRNAAFAAIFLLAFAVFTSGCGRPPDEAWLRCLGFQQSSETISVLEVDLTDETSGLVDIELANSSLIIGTTTGIGVLVNRARVDYRMTGYSPPPADYPVNLYLSPPADGNPTTGLLTDFPLASTSLRQWLIDNGFGGSVVELNARVTFYGLTDEGGTVETEASLGIALTNTGGGVTPPPATKPTVSITRENHGELSTFLPGKFKVERSAVSSSALTVVFSVSGLDSGIDFVDIGTTKVIAASQQFAEISITPMLDGYAGPVTLTLLNNNDSYTISPSDGDAMLYIFP